MESGDAFRRRTFLGGLGQGEHEAATSGCGKRLYIPKIEELLRFPDTRKYGPATGMLAEMRKLLIAAGEKEEFVDYVAGIHERFGRRPSLMAELARRGL